MPLFNLSKIVKQAVETAKGMATEVRNEATELFGTKEEIKQDLKEIADGAAADAKKIAEMGKKEVIETVAAINEKAAVKLEKGISTFKNLIDTVFDGKKTEAAKEEAPAAAATAEATAPVAAKEEVKQEAKTEFKVAAKKAPVKKAVVQKAPAKKAPTKKAASMAAKKKPAKKA